MKSTLIIGLALLALAACDSDPPAATSSWQEPASYQYTVDSRCGEQLLIGSFQLTVAAGKVTKVEGVDEPGRQTAANVPVDHFPTLKDLVAQYETARAAKADVATVVFDPGDGHPTRIDIDGSRSAMDDESCYVISAYRPD